MRAATSASLREFWQVVRSRELSGENASRHSPERRRTVAGEIIVRFGKHNGLKIKEVPFTYLALAVNQEPSTELFRKFQQHFKAYLGN